MRAAALLCLLRLCSSDYSCTQPLDDFCPPEGRAAAPGADFPQCDPYAAPVPPGADLLALRTRLINALFGVSTGALPSAPPDAITPAPLDTNTSRGCWCSTLGNCPAAACQWHNNLTELVFTTTAHFPNGSALSLNSTAFWTLNTSGVAPSNYIGENGPPAFPTPPLPPQGLSGTLVIWHNGHNSPCVIPGGDADYDGTVDWLNQLGYDVLSLHMPTYQVNAAAPPFACNHSAFAPLEAQGLPVFRFFMEPIVRAVAFAEARGYAQVVMGGLSGGGWSTTLAAAIDPRIGLSMPVAGSVPCDFAHVSWDFEQQCNSSWAMVANYSVRGVAPPFFSAPPLAFLLSPTPHFHPPRLGRRSTRWRRWSPPGPLCRSCMSRTPAASMAATGMPAFGSTMSGWRGWARGCFKRASRQAMCMR